MIMILLLILPDEADAQQLWLSKTSIAYIEWHSVAYGQDANGNGLFVAVARTGSAGNQVMTSPDGNDPWTPPVLRRITSSGSILHMAGGPHACVQCPCQEMWLL
jgi:hypothetical protein